MLRIFSLALHSIFTSLSELRSLNFLFIPHFCLTPKYDKFVLNGKQIIWSYIPAMQKKMRKMSEAHNTLTYRCADIFSRQTHAKQKSNRNSNNNPTYLNIWNSCHVFVCIAYQIHHRVNIFRFAIYTRNWRFLRHAIPITHSLQGWK